MERRLPAGLRVLFLLMIILSTGWSEHDQDLKFCGFWRHGTRPLTLDLDLSPGCSNISISANQSSLSVAGRITAQCRRSEVIPLERFGLDSREETKFCLYWEPLLDQMKLEVGGRNRTLCWPSSLQGNCCTDLSPTGFNSPEADYGIFNASYKGDFISDKRLTAYSYIHGSQIMCKTLCDQQSSRSSQTNMPVEHPCARSSEVEMKEDFGGFNVTSPVFKGEPAESGVSIHIPPALKKAAKKTNKVVFTFFKNNSLFQEGHTAVRILDDVVEINVENEIIVNLPEPVRINFHHKVLAKRHSTKCVSWDTRKDPLQVNWLDDGCETLQKADDHTECLCNHLTYFAVLVQINPGPVRHLLVLTAITSLGCAVSVISCIALIIYLCRKSRRSKEQSIPIHLGLAVSLAFLNLLFFLTGVLANVWEDVCVWVGAGLHYSLLSSFTWMGIEVFHTFWLVYMVFTPSPKAYIWNLIGFVLPAVPIVILAAVGDIYGLREIEPSDDVASPYKMCWMKPTHKADLAYYFTNLTVLVVLVVSGGVMLVLVYRQIRSRDEWRQNRVAFLSIWGLSCLFGTSWGLTFLDFGPLSDFVLFLFCILNSFQGFFLMLRFCMLDWMRKQAGGSGLGSSSTGSTRQHMLQAQEKS